LAKTELESNDIVAFGQRVLTMATNAGKGWFAILVGKTIDHRTIIPDYILKAIFFAHGPVSRAIVFNILSYRVSRRRFLRTLQTVAFKAKLKSYGEGASDFAQIRQAMLEAFPTDEINNILAGL
jgi:putative ATP-dependent endonuclease of OLD family